MKTNQKAKKAKEGRANKCGTRIANTEVIVLKYLLQPYPQVLACVPVSAEVDIEQSMTQFPVCIDPMSSDTDVRLVVRATPSQWCKQQGGTDLRE